MFSIHISNLSQAFIWLACGFIFMRIVLLILPKYQRDTIFGWIPVNQRGRPTSAGTAPPGTISPEKKITNNGCPSMDYKDTFPPSCREALKNVIAKAEMAEIRGIRGGPVNQDEFRRNIMPFDADYRDCGPTMFTATELSTAEIKALGDFPDYAELSGVPLPQAYEGFNIERAFPRPYRPFRWAYHQTMSLTKMETDWWLEVESMYVQRIQERKRLFTEHGKLVLNHLPGSELACKEIMEMAIQFLCARYPQHFSLFHSSFEGYILHNGILKTRTVISSMHPLHILLENVPEDFAVMLRNPADGGYYLRAGVICSALGWNLDVKMGLQLKEIHAPIPDYKQKMEFSMDRYFSKLPTSRPIQRGSWGLELDTPLFMPPSHPSEADRLTQSPDLSLQRIHLRVDWQTLRRLPLSAAIVFNFKALFTPIEDFRDEAYIPALCAKILKEGKKSLMQYKNTWHVEHVAVPALEEWEKEQVEKGMVEEGWEVRTLEESPWFPGWKEKWKAKQGF